MAFAAVHFTSVSVTVDASNGDLLVGFTEAGLPSGISVPITADASYKAIWGCVTRGGNLVKPTITDLRSYDGAASSTLVITSDKQGRVIGSITLTTVDETNTCSGNKDWKEVKVVWGTVTLTGNGATWTGAGATWNPYGL